MSFDYNNILFDYARIGDVRLHYATAGSGDKLVLLLHGFPEFWYSWRNQLSALSHNFTVVAPDLRGYNLSDKPKRVVDYHIDKLVNDVIGLIDFFGREKAFVIGHDWGAIISWAAALRHPEKIEKLVAMQVPPPAAWRVNFTLEQLFASWYMFFFQIPFLPEWIFKINDFALLNLALQFLASKRIFTRDDLAAYKKSWSEPFALTAAINYYRANVLPDFMASSNTTSLVNKIKVPTLFIYGEREKAIVAESVRGIERFVAAPYAELRIPTAGHWVQQEAVSEVNCALQKFLIAD